MRVIAALFALGALALTARPAHAVIVGTVTNTNVNPASYVGWTQGDPGWNNVTIGPNTTNYVYLGDGWVISARHTGIWSAKFDSGVYTSVENFVVHNPPPSMAGGHTLTAETDLRLLRLNADPGLPSLEIASASPPSSGTSGSEVMFIGQGRARPTNQTHWNLNVASPPPNWTTAETPPPGGNIFGYKAQGTSTRVKRWGTNRLENPGSSVFEDGTFSHVLSNTSAVLPLTTSDNVTRDVISMATRFDQQTTGGALPFESQAVSGDSGGAVFFNRGTAEAPDWVLSGIVNATLIYGNQPRTYAVYGNSTTFADLSYYNQAYKSSICDIMKACDSYSIMGDVNLDGQVTGNGTGATTVDDVSAFVSGWGSDNGLGRGDYETWKDGDLNLDGQTNLADFLLLRGSLNGPIGSGAMTALFGGVPEPSSGILAILAAGFWAAIARRRARR